MALTAGAALAVPTTLTLDEGKAHRSLTPGEEIRMVTEKPVYIEMSTGTVECQDQSDFTAFFGRVTSNSEKTDTLSFETGGFMFGENCGGSSSLGSAQVEPADLPWALSVGVNGKIELKGSPAVAFEMKFSGGASCLYERTTVHGALSSKPIFGSEQLFQPQFADQKFRRNKTVSSPQCPTNASLTAEFPEVVSQENELVYDIANTVY